MSQYLTNTVNCPTLTDSPPCSEDDCRTRHNFDLKMEDSIFQIFFRVTINSLTSQRCRQVWQPVTGYWWKQYHGLENTIELVHCVYQNTSPADFDSNQNISWFTMSFTVRNTNYPLQSMTPNTSVAEMTLKPLSLLLLTPIGFQGARGKMSRMFLVF